MKFVIVFSALFAVALSAAVSVRDYPHAETLRYLSDNIGVDGFKYDVETSDGKLVSEQGVLKNVGTENEAIAVQGVFRYIGDDGITYEVQYIADENGFQPKGAHLPTPPPY